MDKLTKEQRSNNMRAIKNKDTKIERLLAKALWHKGYRYRKNDRTVFGTPDLTLKKYKIAIFCDSEFWHGKNWDKEKTRIKSNINFWHRKIERNIARDIEVNVYLEESNWLVLRFWGKEIKKNLENCLKIIHKAVNERKD